MACSSIALAFALWIVIQFGSQSAMMAAIEATSALKMPMETIKSYLNTYSGIIILLCMRGKLSNRYIDIVSIPTIVT